MNNIEKFIQNRDLGDYFEENLTISREDARQTIQLIEDRVSQLPTAKFGDDCAPLRHTFGDGLYIREITMAKGMIIVSKIHKTEHPFFVMKGECSVITEEKNIRIKAPYWGITKPGTKRVLYIHEETVWATVHATKSKNLEEIEEEIIAKDFSEIEGDKLCLGA